MSWTCSTCGTANEPNSGSCIACGAQTEVPVYTSEETQPVGVVADSRARPAASRPWWPIALAAAVGAVILIAVGVAIGNVGDDKDERATDDTVADNPPETDAPSTTPAPPTTATSTAPSLPPPPTITAPPPPPTITAPPPPSTVGDVAALEPGLFCRDLNARGFSYSAAVEYWRNNGYTDQMDIDRNGIPCETVYPRSDVTAYWGSVPAPSTVEGLPDGLFCRDLAEQLVSYPNAVAYWFAQGQPDRMDEDLNGIPCETVYSASEVQEYWG